MSQTRDQQRFTISEVAADWYEPMVRRSELCGHPLPALTDNGTHGAASRYTIARYTIAPIIIIIRQLIRRRNMSIKSLQGRRSATLGLHPVAVATTHFPSR